MRSRSVKIALGSQQLGQQHRAAGSAAQRGVVILTQTANADSHAVFQHTVQLGLRAVIFLKVMQELLRGAGQLQILCGTVEFLPGLQNFFLRRLILKAHEHRAHVAVRDRHTQALGRSLFSSSPPM